MKNVMIALTGLLVSVPAMAAVAVPVPEPGSLGLLALGLAGVVASRLRRK